MPRTQQPEFDLCDPDIVYKLLPTFKNAKNEQTFLGLLNVETGEFQLAKDEKILQTLKETLIDEDLNEKWATFSVTRYRTDDLDRGVYPNKDEKWPADVAKMLTSRLDELSTEINQSVTLGKQELSDEANERKRKKTPEERKKEAADFQKRKDEVDGDIYDHPGGRRHPS